MATIVKAPTPKRTNVRDSVLADTVRTMARMKSGQAVEWQGHPTGAYTLCSSINAYVGSNRFRAYAAQDDKLYISVAD